MNARTQPNASKAAELFASQGFVAPVPIYTAAECKLVLDHFRSAALARPHAWTKGYGTSDRLTYEMSVQPPLLHVLREILGSDIVLWGVSLVERTPGAVHPWHTDIESSGVSGGFATVWVGLENTSVDSALQLISGSHHFGKPIQQVVQERGLSRKDASAEMVERWAKDIDSTARLIQPAVSDGEAIIFDGRAWHGSKNTYGKKRAALLLQYVRADTPVFIPDFGDFSWPFHLTTKRPPSVLVSGSADSGGHDLLLPPGAGLNDHARARPDLPQVGREADQRDLREERGGWVRGLRKLLKKQSRSIGRRYGM